MAKRPTTEIEKPAEGEIVERRGNENGEAKPKGIAGLLAMKKDAMAAVATAHLTPEKLIKIVGVAMSRTPLLLQCDPMTVLNSVMTLAELGLSPGPLGDAYLIPFKNGKTQRYECQLIIGYRGMVTLARRSGQISTITAEVVREGDEWEFELGLDAKLRHVPKAKADATIRLAYALVKFKDGSHQICVMTKDEIDGIRRRSRAAGSGPWVSDYAEMAKKTVIRRLCKLLPLTPELETAIATVDRTEFDFDSIAEPTHGAGALADRLLGGDEPEPEIEEEIDPDTGEVIPPAGAGEPLEE